MPSRSSHLIITVHGIRTYGHWQEQLEQLVKSNADVEFVNYKFGYIPTFFFLIPYVRRSLARKFRATLLGRCAERQRTRVDLVAHSFGTYVVAEAVAGLSDPKIFINTIILSGSVLGSAFPWHSLIGSHVGRVINDCGSKDRVLPLSQILGLGMAGRVGFTGPTSEKLRNRYSPFGHGGYFHNAAGKLDDEYMRRHWVPLLTSDDPAPDFSFRPQLTMVDRFTEYPGLIRFAIYVVLVILPLLAFNSYQKTLVQAETALTDAKAARAQDELSRKEAGIARTQAANELLVDDPDKAMLLVLEALPDQSRGIDRPAVAGARLTLEKAVRASKEVARLIHAGRVTSVSFSPNGRWLATSSSDRSARIFEVKTGAAINQLIQDGPVNRVLFSPDGRLIATASSDKTARIWDATTGKQLASLVHDGWSVLDIAFSPDSKLLATASGRNGDWRTKAYARVWDVATAAELLRIAHDDDVQSVEFNVDGRLVLTRSGRDSAPGEARVTEVSTGRELTRKAHESYALLSVAFNPDGRSFATASSDRTARIWDIATGNELTKLSHDAPVRSMKFSPDGRILATEFGGGPWNKKGEAQLWGTATGKLIARIAPTEDITELAFSRDGRLLATGSRDEIARVWNVETGTEVRRFPHSGEVRSVAFSPDGRILATGSYDNRTHVLATASDVSGPEYMNGLAQLWNVTEAVDFPEIVTVGWLSSAAFSSDGRLITTSSGGPGPFQGEGRLWDADTSLTVAKFLHSEQVLNAILSPDGKLLATETISGGHLWQVGTGTLLRQFPSSRPYVFSPDSQILVTSASRAAQLWAVGSGKKLAELPHDGDVRSAAFNRDGSRLVTVAGGGGPEGYKGEARLWDPRTGKLTFVLKHEDWVCCIDFSPNGNLLATASSGHKARIWNTKTGEEQVQFNHNGEVTSVAFSPNGRILASASDNFVYLWDAVTGQKLTSLLHDRSKSSSRYKVPSQATKPDGRLYGSVRAIAFSPDGLLLATAAGEVTRLWEVGTGNELAQYSRGLESEVKSVAFSRDGLAVMAASESGTLRRWRVFTTTQSLVDFARARAARCLTEAERSQYSLTEAPPQWCVERNLWPYRSRRSELVSARTREVPGWLSIGTDQ
jgi:WD40 repeat protein